MASSCPLTLFPDLNDPLSSPGQSALALTLPNLPMLTVEQIMAAQSDIETNHYTLKSCMETVAAVSNLAHRLQNRTSEISTLKTETKELKWKATIMVRFGVPSYSAFDDQRGVNSLGGLVNTEAGPSKVSQDEIKMKKSARGSNK
ncbi:hypothetical protein ACSBR1_033358 [Camellia fascicularis]